MVRHHRRVGRRRDEPDLEVTTRDPDAEVPVFHLRCLSAGGSAFIIDHGGCPVAGLGWSFGLDLLRALAGDRGLTLDIDEEGGWEP